MKISADVVLEALKKVNEPDLGKDIVTLGLVSDINILETKISFSVQMKNAAMHARKRMEEAFKGDPKVKRANQKINGYWQKHLKIYFELFLGRQIHTL